MTVYSAAHRYVRRGLPAIPLCAPVGDGCSCPYGHDQGSIGKRPKAKGWREHFFVDENDIGRDWPPFETNIGLPTGPESGLTVLDVDVRHDGLESLYRLEERGLPKTWTVETGSGGLHYYFRHEPTVPNGSSGQKSGPLHGIDVKDAGGYVVGPPSIHRSGGRYRWLVGPSDVEVAAQPEWLLELRRELAAPAPVRFAPVMPSRPAGGSVLERARRYVARMEPAISGQGGHNRTLRVASQIAVGFDLTDDEALDVLREWNAGCVPPWSDRELLRKIREARRLDSRPVGFRLAT